MALDGRSETLKRTCRVTLKTEILQTFEVDLDAMQDAWDGRVDVSSVESVGDYIECEIQDQGDKITTPWMRELQGLGEGSRDVYEVDLGGDDA